MPKPYRKPHFRNDLNERMDGWMDTTASGHPAIHEGTRQFWDQMMDVDIIASVANQTLDRPGTTPGTRAGGERCDEYTYRFPDDHKIKFLSIL